jgi:transposase
MIELTQDMRIMVAVKPAHFRSGIDALSGLCRSVLNEDPRGGSVFVFRNKSATAVKILAYQGRGFWLTHYRLSSGKFPRWPQDACDSAAVQMLAEELRRLLLSRPSKGSAPLQWQCVAPQAAASVTPPSLSEPESADTSRASTPADVSGWPWRSAAR